MKKLNAGSFVIGLAAGLVIAFCLGAGENPKEAPPEAPKDPWSDIKVVSYPNGTGFFDAATGTMYVYDTELRNCFLTRRLVRLGQPMR